MLLWLALALAAEPFPSCNPYAAPGAPKHTAAQDCGDRSAQFLTLGEGASADDALAHAIGHLDAWNSQGSEPAIGEVDLAGTAARTATVALSSGTVWVQIVAGRTAVLCRDTQAGGDIELARRWCVDVARASLVPNEAPKQCGLEVIGRELVHEAGIRATLPAADDWTVDCDRRVVRSQTLAVEVEARSVPAPSSWNELAWLLDLAAREKKTAKGAGLSVRGPLVETHDGQRVLTYTVRAAGSPARQWTGWVAVPEGGRIAELRAARTNTGMAATGEQKAQLIVVLRSISAAGPE